MAHSIEQVHTQSCRLLLLCMLKLHMQLFFHIVKVLKVVYWSRNGVLFSELLEVSF